MGKGPFEAAKLAKAHGKNVIVLAGSVSNTESLEGIDAVFSIVSGPCSLAKAMEKETAYQNLKRTAAQIFRLIASVRGK
jgi:glycerate kinase